MCENTCSSLFRWHGLLVECHGFVCSSLHPLLLTPSVYSKCKATSLTVRGQDAFLGAPFLRLFAQASGGMDRAGLSPPMCPFCINPECAQPSSCILVSPRGEGWSTLPVLVV